MSFSASVTSETAQHVDQTRQVLLADAGDEFGIVGSDHVVQLLYQAGSRVGQMQREGAAVGLHLFPPEQAAFLQGFDHDDEIGTFDAQRLGHRRLAQAGIELQHGEHGILRRPNVQFGELGVKSLKHGKLRPAQPIAEMAGQGTEIDGNQDVAFGQNSAPDLMLGEIL